MTAQHPSSDAADSSFFPELHIQGHESTYPSGSGAVERLSVDAMNDGKEQVLETTSQRVSPTERVKNLLDLPVDILQMIVKEITHTNDLTALALTNSTLHSLAVPLIYARFDIVWPDANTTVAETKSVDALTYGLSTLCLGSTFARRTQRLYQNKKTEGVLQRPRRRDFASYTKKFSLGNGPSEWVAEYMITKESGKMLGTLVALAIQKMVNLEAFVWDMPTGVLSEIFMALDSLRDHTPDGECKLERVWVRWHDNKDGGTSPTTSGAAASHPTQAVVPVGSSLTSVGILLPVGSAHPAPRPTFSYSQSRVECPTFSILPPLKSLSVLDIDELAYLDEMSMLIERSKDRLQELRVGISAKAMHEDFVQSWDSTNLAQVDHNARWPGESAIGERRLGGVLGVLVGRIFDIRRRVPVLSKTTASIQVAAIPSLENGSAGGSNPTSPTTPTGTVSEVAQGETLLGVSQDEGQPPSDAQPRTLLGEADPSAESKSGRGDLSGQMRQLDGKLRLQTLELERVPLSMQVCGKAIDWTTLTNLTLLDCTHSDSLWKLLKRQFQPSKLPSGFDASGLGKHSGVQYHLSLKSVHTDTTSPHLIAFLKETLAPNSLQVLFLQDRRRMPGPPSVSIDSIFKGPLKRHRSSLQKLLLDSTDRKVVGGDDNRWSSWVLTLEIVKYITSGRMSSLRELSVALDFRFWHLFLQRLPAIPQLRSLHVSNFTHRADLYEDKDLVLEMLDIITLRPEIELCYVGIGPGCFEILEDPPQRSWTSNNPAGLANGSVSTGQVGPGALGGVDDEDEDEDDDDDETGSQMGDDESGSDSDGEGTVPAADQHEEGQAGHGHGDADDSDDDSFCDVNAHAPVLRLREILFYDDKVAIFKARHGRL